MLRRFLFSLIAVLSLVAGSLPDARGAEITPDEQSLLNDLSSSGKDLKSIVIEGTITGDFDVAGMKDHYRKSFAASWIAGGAFRQSVPEDQIIGSTGSQLYQFLPAGKQFEQQEVKETGRKLPQAVHAFLIDQNLQLLLVGEADAAGVLQKSFKTVRTGSPEKIGDSEYQTIIFEDDARVMTVLVDPATKLLRQTRTDSTKLLKQRGAADVLKASVIVDYTKIQPNAPLKAEQFAWSPPPGARDMAEQGGGDSEPNELEGKPAPAFTLKLLDGKDVSLADQKGKVVVIDFWATWCGPCVASLPKLEEVAKARAADGVVVFTINAQEEKETVAKFVEKRKMSLPVLLDPDGATAKNYKVNGIPQTVVIGKDGVVKKVFVGFNPNDGEKRLNSAIDEALR